MYQRRCSGRSKNPLSSDMGSVNSDEFPNLSGTDKAKRFMYRKMNGLKDDNIHNRGDVADDRFGHILSDVESCDSQYDL